MTPNLDRLAERGIRYTNFYANAPVCAVARSSWIFGVPAVTTGTLHMRSQYRVPRERFKTYPELIRASGYYVTNRRKTDYNTRSIDPSKIWDESSKFAHFKKRPDGVPFFAVFNFTESHESSLFPGKWPKKMTVPAEAIKLPPYQIRTQETVDSWRAYYEQVREMDRRVGSLLKELEASGQADNTIIIYCSDHGGVTLRSKRYLYDSGTNVPLIVAFPEKWQHLAPGAPGSVSDRLTQFIDLPKTFLSLVGVEAPEVMSGRVFLGDSVEPAPDSVFLFSGRFDEASDNSRGVTDGHWKYIRNFESDRPLFQMLSYPLRQKGQVAQLKAYKAGKTDALQSAFYLSPPPEELYDTKADPHEVNNLASSHPEKLKAMRAALRAHILETHDLGFIPEPMMEVIDASDKETIFSYGQCDESYPLPRILDLAIKASDRGPAHQLAFAQALEDHNPIIRYWGSVGLRGLAAYDERAHVMIAKALTDSEPSVRIQAAIALGRSGEVERATDLLLGEALAAKSDMHGAWALDGIKLLDAPEAITSLRENEIQALRKGNYTKRILDLLRDDGSIARIPSERQ